MNTSIVIAAILFAILLFARLMLLKRQKNQSKIFRRVLDKLIKKNKLIIHYKDVFNNKLIGFDRLNKKILLLDLNEKNNMKYCIELDEIESCRIIHSKDKVSKCLKKVFLEITYTRTKKPIEFCFYDESCDDDQKKIFMVLKAQHRTKELISAKNIGELVFRNMYYKTSWT